MALNSAPYGFLPELHQHCSYGYGYGGHAGYGCGPYNWDTCNLHQPPAYAYFYTATTDKVSIKKDFQQISTAIERLQEASMANEPAPVTYRLLKEQIQEYVRELVKEIESRLQRDTDKFFFWDSSKYLKACATIQGQISSIHKSDAQDTIKQACNLI